MSGQSPRGGTAAGGWTPRGKVTAALLVVFAAILVLSHLGVQAKVLAFAAVVAAVAAGVALLRLPAEPDPEEGEDGRG